MGRRPAYEPKAVIEAASQVFWERGYQTTSIGDLEERTGLDRSSLYHAFGSKQAVFEAALGSYLEIFLAGLRDVLRAGSGIDALAAWFTAMAQSFRSDPARGSRGCLMVNTLAELGASDPGLARLDAAYRDGLREAFAAALGQARERGDVDADLVQPRARLLASLVMGLFLTARIDPGDAAGACDDAAALVSSWRRR